MNIECIRIAIAHKLKKQAKKNLRCRLYCFRKKTNLEFIV